MSDEEARFAGVLAPVAYRALKLGWGTQRNARDDLLLSVADDVKVYVRCEPVGSSPSQAELGLSPRDDGFVVRLSVPLIDRVDLSVDLLMAVQQEGSLLPPASVRVSPIGGFAALSAEHVLHGVDYRPEEVIGVAMDIAASSEPVTKLVERNFGGERHWGPPDPYFTTVLTIERGGEGELVESPDDPLTYSRLPVSKWRTTRQGTRLPECMEELFEWTVAEAERQQLPSANPLLFAQVCAKRNPDAFKRQFGDESVDRVLALPREMLKEKAASSVRQLLRSTADAYDPTTRIVMPWVLDHLKHRHPQLKTILSGESAPEPTEAQSVRADQTPARTQRRGGKSQADPPTRKQIARALQVRVKGQDDVVAQVASRLAMTMRGLTGSQSMRPRGVFLFAGPTGVGKTELAKAIAQTVYPETEQLIRLDMSEYSDGWAVSRLIGPPPGFVGFSQPAGWLTTKVSKNPKTVVLLDEFEKGHGAVWQTFLQVLDEGRLTDGTGRTVDFSETVIVMTSNLGSRRFMQTDVGFAQGTTQREEQMASERSREVIGEIRKELPPELFNRIDQSFVFKPLSDSALIDITRERLRTVQGDLSEVGYDIKFTPAVAKLIALHDKDPALGARPILRTIDRLIREPLADLPVGGYKARAVCGKVIFSESAP